MTGSLIFFTNFKESKEPTQLIYHMSMNNYQAIQKSCIDRSSHALLTLGSESETLVSLGLLPFTVFKLLNDWQSEFKEAVLQYVNWEVSSDPKTRSKRKPERKDGGERKKTCVPWVTRNNWSPVCGPPLRARGLHRTPLTDLLYGVEVWGGVV